MSKITYEDVLTFLANDDNVVSQARAEIANEIFQDQVQKAKEEILSKKSFLQKIFPYQIEVTKI